MKKAAYILLLSCLPVMAFAGDIYNTKAAKISFFSTAPLENIEAENPNVNCILNTKTGELAFKVIMTSFQFEKQAMKDHFNKDFVESDKYPESVYSGSIIDMSKVDLSKNGVYTVTTKGTLQIHGVKKAVTQAGKLEVKDGKILLYAQFNILLSDYGVKVPSNYLKKINNSLRLTISATLLPYAR